MSIRDLTIEELIEVWKKEYYSNGEWELKKLRVDGYTLSKEIPIDTKFTDSETDEDATEEWLLGVIAGYERRADIARKQLEKVRAE